ncbi:MAG: ABC transporter permease [Oscillibacter sp.]|nr:ABC transporter permease [Oscillibacter sp.]
MKYAFRRVSALLLTMFLVSLCAFAAFSGISGSAAEARLGTQATAERAAALREELGLNRPFLFRYGEWLSGFVSGDLGQSLTYRQNVGELLRDKALASLLLSGMSFALIVLCAVPLSLLVVRAADGPLDVAHTLFNQFLMSVPPFFVGLLLSWIFGVTLRWFTPGAFPGLSRPGEAVRFLLFPAVAIAVPRAAMTVRMLRGTLLRELNRDYVRTAISRGSDRNSVLRRHVLKNALTPTVAFLAQMMAEIVAGVIVVEQVFGVPGLGRMLVVSISNRDYPVVQAIVVILAFWVVAANTAADLINVRIDPRLALRDE